MQLWFFENGEPIVVLLFSVVFEYLRSISPNFAFRIVRSFRQNNYHKYFLVGTEFSYFLPNKRHSHSSAL